MHQFDLLYMPSDTLYGNKYKYLQVERCRGKPDKWVMYYLSDGPERAFVSEELMLIPKDTELPPDYVQKW